MKFSALIHSTTIRLTLSYTAIIMFISIFFSVGLYEVIIRQAEVGLRHQVDVYRQRILPFAIPFDPTDDNFIETQLIDFRTRLLNSLIILNGIILFGAGTLSYWLARRTLQPIEASLERQRRFTADASHELRTPLTVMRSQLEVALRGAPPKPEEYQDIMRSTLEEVQRLEHLSKGLLRLAQFEERQETLPMQSLKLETIVEAAIKSVAARAREKGITIVPTSSQELVLGDETSLIEMLVILLENAIKYSPAKTTIELVASTTDHHLQLQIRDHGHGISPEALPHVFDRFYRADPSRSKERADGYGLGLPIAKQIIEHHGGTISIKSTVGSGTTVTLLLRQP